MEGGHVEEVGGRGGTLLRAAGSRRNLKQCTLKIQAQAQALLRQVVSMYPLPPLLQQCLCLLVPLKDRAQGNVAAESIRAAAKSAEQAATKPSVEASMSQLNQTMQSLLDSLPE